jgi:hypothetical protein
MPRKPGSTDDKKEAILNECIMLISEKKYEPWRLV